MKRYFPFLMKILLLVALVAAVGIFFGWERLFGEIRAFAETGGMGKGTFFVAMSFACVAGFPLSICYLCAGAAFGFAWGWCVCFAVLAASSSLGYAAGRFFVPKRVAENLSAKFGLSGKDSKNMFDLNFFVRAVPGIPYWVQNLIPPAFGSPFFLCVAVNLAVQGMISAAMIYLGASLSDGSGFDVKKFCVFGALVVALIAFRRAVLSLRKKIRARKSGAEICSK